MGIRFVSRCMRCATDNSRALVEGAADFAYSPRQSLWLGSRTGSFKLSLRKQMPRIRISLRLPLDAAVLRYLLQYCTSPRGTKRVFRQSTNIPLYKVASLSRRRI